jgi:hypothetical protein
MAKNHPSDVLNQAQIVLQGWNQIGPTVNFGTLTLSAFTTEITAASTIESDLIRLEAQLTDKRNQRDAAYTALWDKVKRIRNGVKANYGDDSSQLEMVGGTRTSERKAPSRKAVAA